MKNKNTVKKKNPETSDEKKEAEVEKNGDKKKRRKLLMILFLAVVLVGATLFWWGYFMRQPVVGTICSGQGAEAKKVLEKEEFSRFEGKYLSFRHSSKYAVKEHNKETDANGVFLERAALADKGPYARKIFLTVESLIDRKIEDTGNYHFRQFHKKRFREEKVEKNGIAGTVFTDTESEFFEKTFFFARGEYLGEISFVAPRDDEKKLNAEWEDIIGSVQWKK